MTTDPAEVTKTLTKLTQQKLVTWKQVTVDPAEYEKRNEHVAFALEAMHNNRPLRLYMVTYQAYDDHEMPYWTERARLELVGSHGEALWEFPRNNWLHKLYEAAIYQAANVEDVLKDLSKDPS